MDSQISNEIAKNIAEIRNLESSPKSEQEKHNQIMKWVNDDYYEVRLELARLMHLFPLKEAVEKLLNDPVPKVRITLIENTPQIRKSMDSDFVLSALEKTLNDPIASVRIALANVVRNHLFFTSESVPSLNKRIQSDETPLEAFARIKVDEPLLLKGLLVDPNDDVRMAAAGNYRHFVVSLGLDFVFIRLLNSLHLIFTDEQWRVRTIGAELVFGLAILSPPDFFDHYLYPFYERFITDPCQKVSEYAISALPTFVEHFCSLDSSTINDNASPNNDSASNNNDGTVFKSSNDIKSLPSKQKGVHFYNNTNYSNADDEHEEKHQMRWLMKSLIVKLENTLTKEDNFINKQTYLLCLSELAGYIPIQFLRNTLFLPLLRTLKDSTQSDNVIILTLDILYDLRDSIHPFQKNRELKPILDRFLNSRSTDVIKERASKLLESFQ